MTGDVNSLRTCQRLLRHCTHNSVGLTPYYLLNKLPSKHNAWWGLGMARAPDLNERLHLPTSEIGDLPAECSASFPSSTPVIRWGVADGEAKSSTPETSRLRCCGEAGR